MLFQFSIAIKCLAEYFDNSGRNVFASLTETADELLEVSVHVLKHQIQNCKPLLILPLFHIHQPITTLTKQPFFYYFIKNYFRDLQHRMNRLKIRTKTKPLKEKSIGKFPRNQESRTNKKKHFQRNGANNSDLANRNNNKTPKIKA